MISLQSRMSVNELKEEQIALPPVSPLLVFIDTVILPAQTRFSGAESSAPRNRRVVWQRILF